MQVFADTHGHTVWLGERDCSAQRRHQKLIEESPAPLFAEEMRRAMGEAATKVAQACGYVNAGTVEFLYEDGAFYFLEMNTRLQVEHPVTELVTGLDLVAEQIRVASGEPLSFTQQGVRREGSAIEVRINAEDPADGAFLPSPGVITRLRVPHGFGVRWDGGYEAGDEVSQFYDNLLAKLIVWGIDRPTAIARAVRALEELSVEGVATTVPADLAILRHPDFLAGRHSTRWVEQTLNLSDVESGEPGHVALAAPEAESKVRRDVDVEVNGRRFSVSVWVPESQLAGGPSRGTSAGGLRTPGRGAAPRPRRSAAAAAAAAGDGEVIVPMQGTIVKVLVQPGDEVEAGQPVCVLEAMKMENNIAADRTGTVTEVNVEAGQSVGSGDVVVVIG
jgi:acetyl-CoA/propionyl-CoA carboxylase biotin carboxyl carrier protein